MAEIGGGGRAEGSAGHSGVFVLGACFALLVFAGNARDLAVGLASGGDLTAFPRTAVERYAELSALPFLGLYRLDLLKLPVQLAFFPVFLALKRAHPESNAWAHAGFALGGKPGAVG